MAEQFSIRELCREHGLTQKALAERFEIPLRTVEDWSTGKRKPPEYVIRMIKTILESTNSDECEALLAEVKSKIAQELLEEFGERLNAVEGQPGLYTVSETDLAELKAKHGKTKKRNKGKHEQI